MKQEVKTTDAPEALGPYSQAVVINDTVYVSGQIALNIETNVLEEGIENQTNQVFKNISAILDSVDLNLNNIVKTTVYLTDMNDFTAMNSVYEKYFDYPYPARSLAVVSKLPKNSLIEVEVIANKNS